MTRLPPRATLLRMLFGLSLCAWLLGLPAPCGGGLKHQMDCRKVLQIRLGQSPDQVRALIGDPWFEGENKRLSGRADPLVGYDYEFIYGDEKAPTHVVYGVRDELNVDFLQGRVVSVTANQTDLGLIDKGNLEPALFLNQYVTPAPWYQVGANFTSMFRCSKDLPVVPGFYNSGFDSGIAR